MSCGKARRLRRGRDKGPATSGGASRRHRSSPSVHFQGFYLPAPARWAGRTANEGPQALEANATGTVQNLALGELSAR